MLAVWHSQIRGILRGGTSEPVAALGLRELA
jgi:hypothetical protein